MELSFHVSHQPSMVPLNTTLPVAHTAENQSGDDAEGERVQYVGQQHLPLLVQAILTFLVTDSSQHGNWHRRHVPKTVSYHTTEGGKATHSNLRSTGAGSRRQPGRLHNHGIINPPTSKFSYYLGASAVAKTPHFTFFSGK